MAKKQTATGAGKTGSAGRKGGTQLKGKTKAKSRKPTYVSQSSAGTPF
jgi:hypothetical protein